MTTAEIPQVFSAANDRITDYAIGFAKLTVLPHTTHHAGSCPPAGRHNGRSGTEKGDVRIKQFNKLLDYLSRSWRI